MAPTRVVLAVLVLVLAAAAMTAAPCAPTDSSLCLSASRFQVSVSWKDFQGNTGSGHAVTLTADTGYFWFFSDSNVELIVKVLDATAINGKFWVFFGALSNVEYTLTVRDSVTGSTKTYQNPSGQFASVGDTQAFAGESSAPAVTETVATRGTPASPGSLPAIQAFIDDAVSNASTDAMEDFTPCPSVAGMLVLSSCRFAVNVDWTDSQGNTGRGTPVQLTADTGYFWFFSDSNVELMVKVLDARPINGNIWVFFGALSNVAYTVTVTDSLSGAVHTYTNPANTFASVGDTAAFTPGLSVHPIMDASRAVSADIDSTGGSLTATGADGTQFTLAIPENAVGSTVTITMTPLASIDDLPLSKGLVGGVQIEPEGLGLFMPATLTIQAPAALRPDAAGFSYLGDGQEFGLDVNQVDGGTMTLQLLHFSGYGGGNPGQNDTFGGTFLDPLAGVRQQGMEILERGREHLDENFNVIPPELTPLEVQALLSQLVEDAFNNILFPAMDGILKLSICDIPKLKQVVQWVFSSVRLVEFFHLEDADTTDLTTQAFSKAVAILQNCLKKTHDQCVAYRDPLKAWDMVEMARALELLGADTGDLFEVGGPFETCLRFQLELDSTVTDQDAAQSVTRHVTSSFPLRLTTAQLMGSDPVWTGSGTLDWVSLSATVADSRCTATFEEEPGRFDVTSGDYHAEILPLRAPSFYDPLAPKPARMFYDPGQPQETETIHCGSSNPETLPTIPGWRLDLETLHRTEAFESGFQTILPVIGVGGIYAQKTYSTPVELPGNGVITESTTLTIRHTPDAQ